MQQDSDDPSLHLAFLKLLSELWNEGSDLKALNIEDDVLDKVTLILFCAYDNVCDLCIIYCVCSGYHFVYPLYLYTCYSRVCR